MIKLPPLGNSGSFRLSAKYISKLPVVTHEINSTYEPQSPLFTARDNFYHPYKKKKIIYYGQILNIGFFRHIRTEMLNKTYGSFLLHLNIHAIL